MNPLKTKQRIKIAVAILAAYVLVTYTSPKVFVADTPTLNDEFIAWVTNSPHVAYAFVRHPLSAQKRDEIIQNASLGVTDTSKLQFNKVATNVERAEDPTTHIKYIKLIKGTSVEERTEVVGGKSITIIKPVKNN